MLDSQILPSALLYTLVLSFNEKTRAAITHTRHCLTGCAIGEILGMAIGVHWSNFYQTGLAVVLAFFFGYLLTFMGARKRGNSSSEAVKIALKVDSVSITSMEVIDNIFVWLIPGAINAGITSWLFWWSLPLSLVIAFILTVPVNRWMIGHSHHALHH